MLNSGRGPDPPHTQGQFSEVSPGIKPQSGLVQGCNSKSRCSATMPLFAELLWTLILSSFLATFPFGCSAVD